MSYTYLFKYIIVGDSGCGKSCLLLKFTDNRFENFHDVTIGVEFGTKIINVNDEPIKIQIWDSAGQESFRSITRSYYRNSTAVLLVFDISRRITFKSIIDWLKEVKKEASNDTVVFLIGNKCDLEHRRQVKIEEAEALAKEYGLTYLETSAKLGIGVKEMFEYPAQIVYNKIREGNITVSEENGIKLGTTLKSGFHIYENPPKSYWDCCIIS